MSVLLCPMNIFSVCETYFCHADLVTMYIQSL